MSMQKPFQVFMGCADLIMSWAPVTKQYQQQKCMEPSLLSTGLCQSKCTVPDVTATIWAARACLQAVSIVGINSLLNYKLAGQQEN